MATKKTRSRTSSTKKTGRSGGKGGAQNKRERYESLHDLFILKLNSLYYVEKALVKVLPKMAKAAGNPDLRDAFSSHLAETEGHVARLEEALESIGQSPKRVEVAAIDGLVEDAEWCIKTVKNREARDAVLIAAAQYVENYERAGYGTAQEWALVMGHAQAADLLNQTLEEEEAANNKLTGLAEGGINDRANTDSAIGSSSSGSSSSGDEM